MTDWKIDKPEVLNPEAQICLQDLMQIFFNFEKLLAKVPIIKRLNSGTFTIEDYQDLLVNLKVQVVEGARWITSTASSFDSQYLEVRSIVIGHAKEEHRDYQILESDYLKAGGSAQRLQNQKRNAGTEALHAFLMHRASHKNPIDMLGAMWIIEGLGNKMATEWAERVDELTGGSGEYTQFMRYHGENDANHLDKLYFLMDRLCKSSEQRDEIARTASVVAKLYAMQLSEIDA